MLSYTGAILNLIMYLVVYYAAGSIDTLKTIGNGIDNIKTKTIKSPDIVLTGKQKCLKYIFNITGYGLLVVNNSIGANSFFQAILALGKKANNTLINEDNMYVVAWLGGITIFIAGNLFQSTLFKNIINKVFNYLAASNDVQLASDEDEKSVISEQKFDSSFFTQLDDIESNDDIDNQKQALISSSSDQDNDKDEERKDRGLPQYDPRFTPHLAGQPLKPSSLPEQKRSDDDDDDSVSHSSGYNLRITADNNDKKSAKKIKKEEAVPLLAPSPKYFCNYL